MMEVVYDVFGSLTAQQKLHTNGTVIFDIHYSDLPDVSSGNPVLLYGDDIKLSD